MENMIAVNDSTNELCTLGRVYGLNRSLEVSGYPMKTEVAVEGVDTMVKRGTRLGGTDIGEGHDNFLLGIVVQFDVNFTNKAWVEAERYHFFDIVSSMSTMHRITKFDLDKAYNKYVDFRVVKIMKEKVNEYNMEEALIKGGHYEHEERLVAVAKQKELYLEILYTNPAGFMLKSGMTTNYRQLKTMVVQRHKHRLPEWREFTNWCLTLPSFCELTGLDFDKYYNQEVEDDADKEGRVLHGCSGACCKEKQGSEHAGGSCNCK